MRIRPSPKFLALVEFYGTVNAAATAFGIPNTVLGRFIDGTGGLSLDTAVRIADKLGVRVDALFVRAESAEKEAA